MNVVTAFPQSSFVPVARASRRIATRRGVVLPCQAVRESDFKLVADRTLDISVDGLLIPVREPILTGETLIVSFPIPGCGSMRRPPSHASCMVAGPKTRGSRAACSST